VTCDSDSNESRRGGIGRSRVTPP
jgi:hypothetical protein